MHDSWGVIILGNDIYYNSFHLKSYIVKRLYKGIAAAETERQPENGQRSASKFQHWFRLIII